MFLGDSVSSPQSVYPSAPTPRPVTAMRHALLSTKPNGSGWSRGRPPLTHAPPPPRSVPSRQSWVPLGGNNFQGGTRSVIFGIISGAWPICTDCLRPYRSAWSVNHLWLFASFALRLPMSAAMRSWDWIVRLAVRPRPCEVEKEKKIRLAVACATVRAARGVLAESSVLWVSNLTREYVG